MSSKSLPVKPKRVTKPPTHVLVSKYEEVKRDLLSIFEQTKDFEKHPDTVVKKWRSSLKPLWSVFENIHYEVESALCAEGATNETDINQKTFLDLHKTYHSRRNAMMFHLVSCGVSVTDSRSSVVASHLSDEDHVSLLQEQLSVARVKQRSNEQLANIEQQQCKAKYEHELQQQNLDKQKQKVILDEQVEILSAKLNTMTDPIVSKLNYVPKQRSNENLVSSWLLDSSALRQPDPTDIYPSTTTAGRDNNIKVVGNIAQTRLGNNIGARPKTSYLFPHDELQKGQTNYTTSHGGHNVINDELLKTSLNPDAKDFFPSHSAYKTLHPEVDNNSRECYKPEHVIQQNPKLDSATKHLVLLELKRSPAIPFSGNAHEFHSWISSLKNKMSELQVSVIDAIEILEAHTDGPARDVVRTFKVAYGAEPGIALKLILSKLERRFGGEAEVSKQLRDKIRAFPEIRGSESDPKVAIQLRKLSDLCLVISAHLDSVPDLRTLNYTSGLELVRSKLPDFMNNRWRVTKAYYLDKYGTHPQFEFFCKFLEERTEQLCLDLPVPNLNKTENLPDKSKKKSNNVVLQTGKVEHQVESEKPDSKSEKIEAIQFDCPLHQTNGHKLVECSSFCKLDSNMKRLLTKNYKLCYRCLEPHRASECTKSLKCDVCNKTNHITVLHYTKQDNKKDSQKYSPRGSSLCTEICDTPAGKSCGKTILVDVSAPEISDKSMRIFAIVDDQSTNSFASPELLNYIGIKTPYQDYSISTLSGSRTTCNGRTATGLQIKGIMRNARTYKLPKTFENDHIPNTKHEAATKQMLQKHPQLSMYANKFPDNDPHADVHLLIGRDGGDVLLTGTINKHAPFVQETPLGWAVVGEVCPEKMKNNDFITLRTAVNQEHFTAEAVFSPSKVFTEFPDDELAGYSTEDREFLNIIENNITVNSEGNLELPLPLRSSDRFPDNKTAVYYRQKNTLSRLKNDARKQQDCLQFMEKLITHKHVEKVSESEIQCEKGKVWYLPLFPVLHPKKLKTRLVFDSAAEYNSVSLNKMLLPGPDQNNKLRGVLCRFREQEVAYVSDVESMFHSFHVPPEQRNYMRFFWHDNNDSEKPLVIYRSRVHIFGNCSSPAIATIGLRKAADSLDFSSVATPEIRQKAKDYIYHNCYVDDALGCSETVSEATQVLKTAQVILAQFNIHLHKIVSNRTELLNEFPDSEKDEKITHFSLDNNLTHRTLGVAWKIQDDAFIVDVNIPKREFTKRGILAVINSVYDPMGIVCPIVLPGKLFQRKVLPKKNENSEMAKYGWDDPLPKHFMNEWEHWKSSLQDLSSISMPRCFKPPQFGSCGEQTLHVFSDASEEAIGHCIYLRFVNSRGDTHVAFVYGESKVSPRAATTVPRLELCAAVEAVQSSQRIMNELTHKPVNVTYYCDSRVVLGYIYNRTRRFTKYVTRRVELLQRLSQTSQWKYVNTTENPADIATRPHTTDELLKSDWFRGPHFLYNDNPIISNDFEAIDLPEEQTESTVLTTATSVPIFGELAERNSKWSRILGAAQRVIKWSWQISDYLLRKRGVSIADREGLCSENMAKTIIISEIQKQHFPEVYRCINNNQELPRAHPLAKLCPFLSADGILKVGGRLKKSALPCQIKHPTLLPGSSPVTEAIIRHYHEKCFHQGRLITNGAITQAGYYILNGRKTIRSYLNSCVICRKLRATCETQLMADLPPDRIEPAAPFDNTGVDVFGPWSTYEGKQTRASKGTKRLWAVIFTCLSSRAVHIECLLSLDTPSFINALRRFIAIRGTCRLMRSDRGTNFVGATNQDMNMERLTREAEILGCKWQVNPPHASHFGGAWERKIGQVRRALDGALRHMNKRVLSRDELTTLLQECAAIVNSTPMWDAPNDPNDPQPLTPSMLLNMKEPACNTIEYNESDLLEYGKRRWKRVQFIADKFWENYRKYYLQNLQARQKWLTRTIPLKSGDLVLLKEKNLNRNLWPMGLITGVSVSSDGCVRSVKVKVVRSSPKNIKNYIYERPISEIVLLLRGSTNSEA